jgi:hypothetical protein
MGRCRKVKNALQKVVESLFSINLVGTNSMRQSEPNSANHAPIKAKLGLLFRITLKKAKLLNKLAVNIGKRV